jgi:hypothetical protein
LVLIGWKIKEWLSLFVFFLHIKSYPFKGFLSIDVSENVGGEFSDKMTKRLRARRNKFGTLEISLDETDCLPA